MSDHLIVVNVTIPPVGDITYKLIDYIGRKAIKKGEVMQLSPGDRVAWLVQVYNGGNAMPVPYTISFFTNEGAANPLPANTDFFGASKLDVPETGTSPFLHVRALQRVIKYSVTIPGLGVVVDPDMQTGDGTGQGLHTTGVAATYTVTWSYPTTQLTCKDSSGANVPFPVTLNFGDAVQFVATVATGPVPTNLVAAFTNGGNSTWYSPFTFKAIPLTITVSPAKPGSVLVKDKGDPAGTTFDFHGQDVVTPSNASGTYQFILGGAKDGAASEEDKKGRR